MAGSMDSAGGVYRNQRRGQITENLGSVSDIPEQAEENRFTACAMAQQKELMQHLAAEYDWQRMMFIDHAGDRNLKRKAGQR